MKQILEINSPEAYLAVLLLLIGSVIIVTKFILIELEKRKAKKLRESKPNQENKMINL